MSQNKQFNCYYREGCHLCEEMTAALVVLQKKMDFKVHYFDIDESTLLYNQYNTQVPVLETVNGELICLYFFDNTAFLACFND